MENKEFIQSILDKIGEFGDGGLEFETRDIERLCNIAQQQVKKCDLADAGHQRELLIGFSKYLIDRSYVRGAYHPETLVKKFEANL